MSIALGDVNTAVLGTDQELINEIVAAGKAAGEKFWQLPLDKEYTKQIKSDIADIRNVGGRKAGTITGRRIPQGICRWSVMGSSGHCRHRVGRGGKAVSIKGTNGRCRANVNQDRGAQQSRSDEGS